MSQELNELDREQLRWESLMRLIEGIMLLVLDHVSISGKWYVRKNISMKVLREKESLLLELEGWMKEENWNTWAHVYGEYSNADYKYIKKNFEKIRKKSLKYVKKRIEKGE